MALTRLRNNALDPDTDITADQLDIGQIGGRRNLIINGGFDVWQRGTSFTSNGYTADRWLKIGNDGVNVSQTTDTTSFNGNSLRIECTANNGSYFGVAQYIELSKDYTATILPNMVLSAMVKSNTSNTVLRNYDGATNITSNAHSGNGQWEKLELVISGRTSVATDKMEISIDTTTPSVVFGNSLVGDYIECTNVQLELGSVATPFEHRPYGEELALCQRYYYKQSSDNDFIAIKWQESGGLYDNRYISEHYFPVTMRAVPTINVSCQDIHLMGVTYAIPEGIGGGSSSLHSCYVEYIMGASLNSNIAGRPRVFELTADAEL